LLASILVGVFILMAFGDNIMRGTATEWCLFAYLGGLAGIMTSKRIKEKPIN